MRTLVGESLGEGHEAATLRAELAAGDALHHGDAPRRAVDHATPHQVPADDTGETVAQLGAVDHDLALRAEQFLHRAVQRDEILGLIRLERGKRVMQRSHPEFFVIVEVVIGLDQGDDGVEPLLAQPDDLFLATNSAMVVAVAAWSLTDRQPILDDPAKSCGG